MRELSKIRDDIAVVDKQITELYKMRMALTEEAAGHECAQDTQ